MSMTPPRANMAIAIDGGGTKGLLVAQALLSLEQAFGGKPLIESPNLKILTGTSTGAVISACVAIGMRMADLVALYKVFSTKVFPPLVPAWLPAPIKRTAIAMIGLLHPSLFSSAPLVKLMRETIQKYTGNPDLTLGQLNTRLRVDQALVFTTVDLENRRTHFLKSYGQTDADWKLWEAVLASSAAPVDLPVLKRGDAFYADGGAGSYGNPAYVAAREAVDWFKFPPSEVSVFSFGTGWVTRTGFEKSNGRPDRWRLLSWALNIPYILIGDNARTQSLDVIDDYIQPYPTGQGMDFRRFQVGLEQDIDPFAPTDQTNAQLISLGDEIGQRILNDQHALSQPPNPKFDPEGLQPLLARYRQSMEIGKPEMNAQASGAQSTAAGNLEKVTV